MNDCTAGRLRMPCAASTASTTTTRPAGMIHASFHQRLRVAEVWDGVTPPEYRLKMLVEDVQPDVVRIPAVAPLALARVLRFEL